MKHTIMIFFVLGGFFTIFNLLTRSSPEQSSHKLEIASPDEPHARKARAIIHDEPETSKSPRENNRQQLNKVDSSTIPSEAESLPRLLDSFLFSEVNPYELDTSGIDPKFLEDGVAFDGKFHDLINLTKGQRVTIDLGPVRYVMNGEIKDSKEHANKWKSVEIKFPDDSKGSYMTLHYAPDGTIEGKLYTSMGNYQITHNGHIGYIISFEDMERLEQFETNKD